MTVTVDGTNGITFPQGAIKVVGEGPAFSARRTTTQTISDAVSTKVQFDTEDFDTNNNYDSATNYRFTPTVAGYYILTVSIVMDGTGMIYPGAEIYKNGSSIALGSYAEPTSGSFTSFVSSISIVTYANGSTDYFEVFAYADVSSGSVALTPTSSSPARFRFTGALVRGA